MHEDALHMAPEGNAFIFDSVSAAVASHYPHLVPDELPLHFPAYNGINVAAPGATFGPLYAAAAAAAAGARS